MICSKHIHESIIFSNIFVIITKNIKSGIRQTKVENPAKPAYLFEKGRGKEMFCFAINTSIDLIFLVFFLFV